MHDELVSFPQSAHPRRDNHPTHPVQLNPLIFLPYFSPKARSALPLAPRPSVHVLFTRLATIFRRKTQRIWMPQHSRDSRNRARKNPAYISLRWNGDVSKPLVLFCESNRQEVSGQKPLNRDCATLLDSCEFQHSGLVPPILSMRG